MGKSKTESAFEKLSKEFTPAKKNGFFADDHDREQFLCKYCAVHCFKKTTHMSADAVIAVATQNGAINLDDHDFRIVYSRRGENEDRIVARLVAIKDGVMQTKIEPRADGKDQAEALKALRKDVEIKLDQILESIPDSSSSIVGASSNAASPVSAHAPPAYTGNGVEILGQKGSK
jgi:hypothetical protein